MIRSIGAVVFDPLTGLLGPEFYCNIDDSSQEDAGLVKDPSTERWWSEQSVDAQQALVADQLPLNDALAGFTSWWLSVDGKHVWGHGASFDPVLLESAFGAVERPVPWRFWDVRCCRTVLALADRAPDRSVGTHHNALDDAKAQAVAVAAALRGGLKERL
jgi:hypothetical protein